MEKSLSDFFDCRLTRAEVAILIVDLVIAFALQMKPVLNSPIGFYLLCVMACVSWMTPVTGFFYIACAQSLPIPEAARLNPAQLGFVMWIFAAFVRYRRFNLKNFRIIWPVVPFLLWFTVVTGEKIWMDHRATPAASMIDSILGSEYVKAIIYAAISCQLVNECKGQYLKCLFGLCAGALTVTFAFWGHALNLPVQLSEWGGKRGEFSRIGGARVDSIMVWPPCLMGAFGLLGITFSSLTRGKDSQVRFLSFVTLIAFVVALPPLVATMSNSAYLGVGLMIVWAFLMVVSLQSRGLMTFKSTRKLQLMVVGIVSVLIIGYVFDSFDVRSRVEALTKNYDKQKTELGIMASRTDYWRAACLSILSNPVTGRAFATEPEVTPPGREPGDYLAHNVFLDYGRWAGLPSLLLLVFFFWYPAVRLWRYGDFDRYIGFLMTHFAMFIFWMVLSFQFYKTFWSLWMLMAMVAHNMRPPARRTQIRQSDFSPKATTESGMRST